MNQPVPVSMNGLGLTMTAPSPQSSVTSASTRAVTSATAGLTRRMASCAENAPAGEAEARAAAATAAAARTRIAPHRITACCRPLQSALSPARLVIRAPLPLGQEIPRRQVRAQVDEAHRAARALDLGDRRPHLGLAGGARGEEAFEARLGVEQRGAARARFGEHRRHQGAELGLLLGAEPQAVPELEDVQRAGIPVTVGREGEPEAAPLGDDLPEPGLARHGVVAGRRLARMTAVLGPRRRPEGSERPHRTDADDERARHAGSSSHANRARYLASASPARWRSATATRSCSRYCWSVLPPRSIARSAKKLRTSASSVGVARPMTPSHMRRSPCFG